MAKEREEVDFSKKEKKDWSSGENRGGRERRGMTKVEREKEVSYIALFITEKGRREGL